MNQLNGGQKEFARAVADNYSLMEDQLAECANKNHQLGVENGVLLAEVNMLREALAASERDRTRLQAVASTFGGQARALQAVFSSIIELAIQNGCDAVEAAAAPQATEKPVQVPREQVAQDKGAAAGSAMDPLHVDWSKLPQGAAS